MTLSKADELDTGKYYGDTEYLIPMDLYHKTGLFYSAAVAYLVCRDKGYAIPEELAEIIENHFRKFIEANDKKQSLAAFSFDSNHKGGAGQKKAIFARNKQEEILGLLQDIEAFGSKNKNRNFKSVARALGTTENRVKQLYYQNRRRTKNE